MAKIIWLFGFAAVYWLYSFYWSSKIAGRHPPVPAFVLVVTAASFSGWAFFGHPGLVYDDGYQFAFVSLCAITIPLAGVIFFKRLWLLGKRYDYKTPAEMLVGYFDGNFIRLLTGIVALLFSVLFVAVQLGAAGYLFDILTDGLVSRHLGMGIMALVILTNLAAGGSRIAADPMPGVLLPLGIVATGIYALNAIGGWEVLQTGLAELAVSDFGAWGKTGQHGGGDYNARFAVPGAIQFTAGLGKQSPVGGPWTGVMILTFMFALMGILSAPAFAMWALTRSDPMPFARQQVWATAFSGGLILVLFTSVLGMGAHLLPPGPAIAKAPDALVASYLNLLADSAPWLAGLLAVSALAVMQLASGFYLTTTGRMLGHDFCRHPKPAAGGGRRLFVFLAIATILALALLVATISTDSLALLGGVAAAFGFQMWVPLAAATCFPWIARAGASWGLAGGILGVIFTDSIGLAVLDAIGIDAWGRWPWTIHSAGWGMFINLSLCAAISAMTQNPQDRRRCMRHHEFLREHASLSPEKRKLKPLAWMITLAWMFFAVGPGAVVGNDFFGSPNAGTPEAWTYGIPSVWAWQILFWLLGVILIWLLAYKMEMSTLPRKKIKALQNESWTAREAGGKQ